MKKLVAYKVAAMAVCTVTYVGALALGVTPEGSIIATFVAILAMCSIAYYLHEDVAVDVFFAVGNVVFGAGVIALYIFMATYNVIDVTIFSSACIIIYILEALIFGSKQRKKYTHVFLSLFIAWVLIAALFLGAPILFGTKFHFEPTISADVVGFSFL